MKKILLPLFCLMAIHSRATTWNVNVDDFQFSPATLNVVVGDIVHFIWVSGTHTTSSVAIPVGAGTWNAPINTTQTSFDYTVAKPDVYSYQ
jgi:plastocyanin